MELSLRIRPVEGFVVETLDGKLIGDFKKTSEWHALTRLEMGNLSMIVSGMEQAGGWPKVVHLVSASPTIIADAMPERPAGPTTCGRCEFDEADGRLIMQCLRCRVNDDQLAKDVAK